MPIPKLTAERSRLYRCVYWIGNGMYGLFSALFCFCCFAVGLKWVFQVWAEQISSFVELLLTVGVGLLSISAGCQTAYRNHQYLQEREGGLS